MRLLAAVARFRFLTFRLRIAVVVLCSAVPLAACLIVPADGATRWIAGLCMGSMAGALLAHALLIAPYRALVAAVGAIEQDFLGRRVIGTVGTTCMIDVIGGVRAIAAGLRERDAALCEINEQTARREEELRTIAENTSDLIVKFDLATMCRTYVSAASRQLYGYEPEDLLGAHPRAIVHPDDWQMLEITMNNPLRNGALSARASYRAIRSDRSVIWVETSAQVLPDAATVIAVTRDITERKIFEGSLEAANAQLEVLASQDALTGLANRRRFDDALASEWRRMRREGAPLGLIMIDVDRFKNYNDTCGHPAGDGCLRAVAEAIQGVIRRPGDLAARYGGEEIALILPNTTADGALKMAARVRDAVAALRIPHPGSEFGVVTVSAGASSFLPSRPDADHAELIDAADRGLYLAKNGGRNTARAVLEDGRVLPSVEAFVTAA